MAQHRKGSIVSVGGQPALVLGEQDGDLIVATGFATQTVAADALDDEETGDDGDEDAAPDAPWRDAGYSAGTGTGG